LNLGYELEVLQGKQTPGVVQGPAATQDAKGLAGRTRRNEIDLVTPCLVDKPSTSEFESILNERSTMRKVADDRADEVGY
jgi:hypothetical protein